MNNLQQIIEMGQQLQSRMAQAQETLEARAVSASSGGGMVTATADGKGMIKKIEIDPTVVDPRDVEMLEDLVMAAIAEAQSKAKAMHDEEMKKLTGGLPLPMQLPGLF